MGAVIPPLVPFSGTVWRALFAGADPLAPVQSPEGRFHHGGQTAIYTSLTAQGTTIAIARYLRPDDPPRVVVPLTLCARQIADLRFHPAASLIWQNCRARGEDAPTWALSDAARAAGAQGLLYASRSQPKLTHLALFDLSIILTAGQAEIFPA